jgi:serine/threonine protein kinase
MMTRIGKGTYGQVYQKDKNVVVKECDKYDKCVFGFKTFELSSISELAILSINGLKHTPALYGFQTAINDKIQISMQNGGNTLLDFAKTVSMLERIKLFPKFAFQMIESCLYFQKNGIIHNDIKSANVLVNSNQDIVVIDFGLCAFETINKVNADFISVGTTMAGDFGTYTICPPETFMYNHWSPEKYMSWSIGITLCEFLFKTHSVICDFVLNSAERGLYRENYRNEWTIKNFLGQVFSNKMENGFRFLLDFSIYTDFPKELQELMNMMLTINYNDRATLKELYDLPVFDAYRQKNATITSEFFGIVPEVHCNVIDKPLPTSGSSSTYKRKRATVLANMFDIYSAFNKTNIFVHAVHIFDKYCSVKTIETKNMFMAGFACAYIAQYIEKCTVIPMKSFMECLSWIANHEVSLRHMNLLIEDILFSLKGNLYAQTFDVQIAMTGEAVNMVTVLRVLKATVPPYNNSNLINMYIDKTKQRRVSA